MWSEYFCRRYYLLFVGTLKNHHTSSGTLGKFYWFIVWLKADWPAVSVCYGSWSATDQTWLQRVMKTGQHITGLPIKPEEQIFFSRAIVSHVASMFHITSESSYIHTLKLHLPSAHADTCTKLHCVVLCLYMWNDKANDKDKNLSHMTENYFEVSMVMYFQNKPL